MGRTYLGVTNRNLPEVKANSVPTRRNKTIDIPPNRRNEDIFA